MHAPALTDHRQKTGEDPVLRFAQWRERLIAAERRTGWLEECDGAGRFLAVSRELVDALAPALRRLAGNGPILEVCAGSGQLARQLAGAGIRLQATDVRPPEGSRVLRMSAQAALRHFQPTVVLGAFVPIDAGVDEAVLSCPSVEHYLVLNARIGASIDFTVPWSTAGWKAKPLESVRRWMLTRHDVWLGVFEDSCRGEKPGEIVQHGEAWHVTRTSGSCGCSCSPHRPF